VISPSLPAFHLSAFSVRPTHVGSEPPLARESSAGYSLSETPLDENLYQRLRFGDRVVARLGKVDVTKEFWGWRTRGFPGIPRRKDREYLGVAGDERIRCFHVHKSRVLAAD